MERRLKSALLIAHCQDCVAVVPPDETASSLSATCSPPCSAPAAHPLAVAESAEETEFFTFFFFLMTKKSMAAQWLVDYLAVNTVA